MFTIRYHVNHPDPFRLPSSGDPTCTQVVGLMVDVSGQRVEKLFPQVLPALLDLLQSTYTAQDEDDQEPMEEDDQDMPKG